MNIEIQSDSSTANSLTDRLGAGQRTKHNDTRYFWIQERVHDGDLRIKKKQRRCWNEASLCFSTTKNTASLQDWYYADHGSPIW